MNVRGGGIMGVKKVKFNDADFGIITGSAYGSALD